MLILNLTNNETSDIKFEVSKFPDGQQQVKITNYKDLFQEGDYEWGEPQLRTDVQIKARLNNFKDLELIICATKSLRQLDILNINLYVPYFLGSRSDRKFEEGSNNYLKDIICPIINSLNFESITVLDPHSDVIESCLNKFKKIDNNALVKWALNTYQFDNKKKSGLYYEDFILISPDAGANKKIFKVAEQIGYNEEIITCSKSRDEQGKLSRIEIPIPKGNFGIIGNKDLIIIDDICDGGATFINIAKEFMLLFPNNKIYLIVTHGIFSKGFDEISKYFDSIYCTNSYENILTGEDYQFNQGINQLNVF